MGRGCRDGGTPHLRAPDLHPPQTLPSDPRGPSHRCPPRHHETGLGRARATGESPSPEGRYVPHTHAHAHRTDMPNRRMGKQARWHLRACARMQACGLGLMKMRHHSLGPCQQGHCGGTHILWGHVTGNGQHAHVVQSRRGGAVEPAGTHRWGGEINQSINPRVPQDNAKSGRYYQLVRRQTRQEASDGDNTRRRPCTH